MRAKRETIMGQTLYEIHNYDCLWTLQIDTGGYYLYSQYEEDAQPALEAFFRDEAKARLALKEILSCGFEAWMVRHPVQQRRWQTSIPESICQRYQHQM